MMGRNGSVYVYAASYYESGRNCGIHYESSWQTEAHKIFQVQPWAASYVHSGTGVVLTCSCFDVIFLSWDDKISSAA